MSDHVQFLAFAKTSVGHTEDTMTPELTMAAEPSERLPPGMQDLLIDNAQPGGNTIIEPDLTPSEPEAASGGTPSERQPATMTPGAHAFLKLGADELMQRIRGGDIPKDVLDSKGGLLQLQARMEQISQMNNLLTQLLNTMHQMNMAIIQNLRA